MIRTLRVYLVGFGLTIYYGARVVVHALRRDRGAGRFCCHCARGWARGILRAAGVSVELEGAGNLTSGVTRVLVANHTSWFDVFALTAHLPVDFRYVGKKELERIPIFGGAWKACGISIDRSDRDAAVRSLEEAREVIRREGSTLIMFPEGTRSPTGELQPFKKGAFVLAIQAGVDVVPVAITGSRKVMPKGRWRIRSGTIRIRVGEPLPVEGLTFDDRDELTHRGWRAVRDLLPSGPVPPEVDEDRG